MSVEELRNTWHERRVRLLEVLQSHPALVITGVYLFLTAVGLLYSTLFFRQLGMHFSDYAQPEDFLMAALKEPLLIVLVVGSIGLVYLLFRLDFWLRERYAWYDTFLGNQWMERINYHPAMIGFVVLVYAFLFTFIYADVVATRAQNGERRTVSVELRTGCAPQHLQRTLLETTAGFLLVYDAETEEARAIPYESVLSLIIAPGAAPADEPAPSSDVTSDPSTSTQDSPAVPTQ